MHLETPEAIEAFLNAPAGQVKTVTRVQRIEIPKLTPLQKEDLLQRQRDHWRNLHTTRMTPAQLEEWIETIPGCATCKQKFRKIVEANPPRFDDWDRWTWEVHNEVNRDLEKPEFLFEKACKLWGWDDYPTSPR